MALLQNGLGFAALTFSTFVLTTAAGTTLASADCLPGQQEICTAAPCMLNPDGTTGVCPTTCVCWGEPTGGDPQPGQPCVSNGLEGTWMCGGAVQADGTCYGLICYTGGPLPGGALGGSGPDVPPIEPLPAPAEPDWPVLGVCQCTVVLNQGDPQQVPCEDCDTEPVLENCGAHDAACYAAGVAQFGFANVHQGWCSTGPNPDGGIELVDADEDDGSEDDGGFVADCPEPPSPDCTPSADPHACWDCPEGGGGDDECGNIFVDCGETPPGCRRVGDSQCDCGQIVCEDDGNEAGSEDSYAYDYDSYGSDTGASSEDSYAYGYDYDSYAYDYDYDFGGDGDMSSGICAPDPAYETCQNYNFDLCRCDDANGGGGECSGDPPLCYEGASCCNGEYVCNFGDGSSAC